MTMTRIALLAAGQQSTTRAYYGHQITLIDDTGRYSLEFTSDNGILATIEGNPSPPLEHTYRTLLAFLQYTVSE